MRTVHVRVGKLVTEILTARKKPLSTVAVPPNTLRRITEGEHDYMLSSLVQVAAALGYDVVINLREQA